jgi:hypothetical protein
MCPFPFVRAFGVLILFSLFKDYDSEIEGNKVEEGTVDSGPEKK